jgi:S-adenosylmethionine synthetase
MKYQLFSSESVCSGHPDKICDQVSDAVLDAALALDPNSRVAVETLVTANKIVLAGEVTAPRALDFESIARTKVKELGYTDPAFGFTHTSPVEVYIHRQSPDISLGVDAGGAGDQGMMFGYACNETSNFMPLPLTLAHRLCQKMDELKLTNSWLRPDGKSQVTVSYVNQKPISVEKVVLAKPLNYSQAPKDSFDFFYQHVVTPVLAELGYDISPQLQFFGR